MPLTLEDLRRWDGARDRPVFFSRPLCAGCEEVRRLLFDRQVSFAEHDVFSDDLAMRLLVAVAGCAKVPAVIFRNEIMIGIDAARLDELLNTPDEPEDEFDLGPEWSESYEMELEPELEASRVVD